MRTAGPVPVEVDGKALETMLRNLISIYQKTGLSSKADQVSTLVEILLTRGTGGQAPLPGGGAI